MFTLQILIDAALVSGVTAAVALIIALADKIVNNYGECRISINGGKKELTVKGGSPLLQTLSAEKIFLPSACGGRGSCGACKVQIISDVGPHLPTEIPYMTPEEIEQNIRLGCQIKVKTDIEIAIDETLFNVKEFAGTVLSINDVTHDIKEVVIDLGGQDISFQAGMYMQFEAPPYEKVKHATQRAYSISSPPSDNTRVELLIRLVPGGIVTGYVHRHLQTGQPIKLVGPFGEFRRHDENSGEHGDATMICVAGGSGMAPIKSILYDMYEKRMFEREVWYFFGARTEKDIFYVEMLRELEKNMPNFHFIAALSEPEEEENKKDAGLITEILDRYFKNSIDTTRMMEGYLCGSPGMIAACLQVMTANNIPEERIFYDKFA